MAARFREAIERIRDEGIHVLMLSGANPTEHLPLGKVFDARGARLTAALVDLADAARGHLRRQLQRPRASATSATGRPTSST